MLTSSSDTHQTNLFGTDLLLQLDPEDPLLKLSFAIPWQKFDQAFGIHYTKGIGAPSKPIRLMVGLLLLKQLENQAMKRLSCSGNVTRTIKPFVASQSSNKASPATVPSWYISENVLAKKGSKRSSK